MKKNQIIVHYGTDIAEMVRSVCTTADLQNMIQPHMRICIKPNLVVAKPANTGATTSPVIVEEVVKLLQEWGCFDISICESSWVGSNTERAFSVCGYEKLAEQYNIKLVNINKTPNVEKNIGDMSLIVSKEILNADFFINVPVLKGHCQVQMTCAMKNLKGCIPNDEKRRYHRLGIHKPVAHLNAVLSQHFILVDALQGDLTFEEGGTPVRMDRIFAGRDPVLIDAYAAFLMGHAPEEIEYINIGSQLGIGNLEIEKAEIIELGRQDREKTIVREVVGGINHLSKHVVQGDACSACYGNLIHALSRLDKKNLLKKLQQPLFVGQKFQKRTEDGIGIGKCTSSFTQTVPGCPPNALAILRYLEAQLS